MAVIDRFADVQKIYLAFYQRAAESSGMRFWAQALDSANGNLNSIINAFANSQEAARLFFPNATQGQTLNSLVNGSNIGTVVDGIFQALFNRAPDTAGRQFFIDGFNRGQFTPGTIALAILGGAQGGDAVSVANKLQVANDITQIADGRLFSNPSFGQGQAFNALYGGDADTALVRQYLATVGSAPATVKSPIDTQDFLATRIADVGDPIRIVQYAPTVTAGSVVEGNGGGAANATVTFTITLDKPAPIGGLVLNVAASTAGTATVGSDFVLPSNTVTVAAGQTTATYTVTVLGELAVEANEQIVLSFSNASRLPTAATGTATIVNDDLPIGLTVGNVSVVEGNPPSLLGSNTTSMTFTLTLSDPAPAGGTTFGVRALSTSTATAGQDFALPSSTVTVAAGQTSATYTVTVGSDSAFEADETVVLEFTNPRLLNPVTATGTIRNDDAGQPYTATVVTGSVSEGPAGTFTPLDFQITLSRPADVGGVTLDVGVDSRSTAIFGDDYVATTGTVSFAEGQQTQVFRLFVQGDGVVEPNETVTLQFSGIQLVAPVSATATILNDDGTTPPAFTVADVSTNEGGTGGGGGLLGGLLGGGGTTGGGTLSYVLNLDRPAPVGGATFSVSVLNTSTAVAGQDFTAPASSFTVPEGQSSFTFSVPIIGDTAREADETVVLQFSSALYGTRTATGTIVNDDASAAYTVTVTNPTVVEGNSGNGNALTFEITLSRPADEGGAVLNVAPTTAGTASNGVDYILPGSTVTFAAGQSKATYVVAVVGDTLAENDETVVLSFSGTTFSPLTAAVTAVGTIVSDDEQRNISLTTSTTDLVTPASTNAAQRTSDQTDIISGVTGGSQTLHATDTIDGGNGNDTLAVTLGSDFTGFTTGSMKNVETVSLTNTGAVARTFNATGVSGVSVYNLSSQGAAPSVINLNALAAVAGLQVNYAGLPGAAIPQAPQITFAAGVTAGGNDAIGLGFNALGTAATTTSAALRVQPVIAGVEVVNATVTGTNLVDLSGISALREFQATGTGLLDVGAVTTELAVFNASGVSGGVNANLSGTANAKLSLVRTGSGDDQVTVELSDLTSQVLLDGGTGGADKLTVVRNGTSTTLTAQSITGFETLEFRGVGSGTLLLNGSQISGVQTLRFVDAAASTASVSNLTVGTGGLRLEFDNTAAGTVTGGYTLNGITGALTVATTANATFAGTVNANSASSLAVQGTGIFNGNATLNANAATSLSFQDAATAGGPGALKVSASQAGSLTVSGVRNAYTLTALDFGNLGTVSLGGLEAAFSLATGQSLSKLTSLSLSGGNGRATVTQDGTAASLTTTVIGSATQAAAINLSVTGLTGAPGSVLGKVQSGSGAITLDLQGALGAVSSGGLVSASGDVTVRANGMLGNLEIDPIAGRVVTFSAATYSGAAPIEDATGPAGAAVSITATDSAKVDGALSLANRFNITSNVVTVNGGSGDDVFNLVQRTAAANPAIAVNAGGGNDTITLTLQDGASTEILPTGTVSGGAGTDTLTVRVSALSTVSSTAGISLAGLTLVDLEGVTLEGNAGANKLTGSSQADTLIGHAGADQLIGGDGSDVFLIAAAADHAAGETITGGNGTDAVYFTSTAAGTLALTANVNLEEVRIANAAGQTTGTTLENLNASAVAAGVAIALTGNDGANVLVGNAAANVIRGNGGDDQITGGAGADSLDGGAGNDTFAYASLADLIASNALVDVLEGGAGTADTVLIGGATAITIAGTTSWARAQGVEVLSVASPNANAISITLSADAFGTAGLRTVTLAADTDAAGGNVVDASAATATQGLTLTGSSGADSLTGGAGADTITAGEGADVVTGGAGSDVINVGETTKVTDVVILNLADVAGGSVDTVNGFDVVSLAAVSDVLRLVNGLGAGNGDGNIASANYNGATNTFSTVSELVVIDSVVFGALNATTAAATIGTASAGPAYALNDVRIFVVGNATDSAVFRFVSSGADSVVSAAELTQIVTLTGVNQTALVAGDITFS